MNDQERKEVAFHEAGHAVIGLVLPYSDKVQKITIIPRGRTGGHVLMTPEDDRFLLTKKELLAKSPACLVDGPPRKSSSMIFPPAPKTIFRKPPVWLA
jgi:ATP-dependent Zn protease